MSTGPDVTHIFISYASADRPRVKPLVDALCQQGWSVWWDRTILAGKTFDRVIEAALRDSRCVIVLWSRDSVDSDWVWTEADDGKRRGILVPAMLDDVNIPFPFRRIQTANLIGWSGALPSEQFNELSRAVSDVLSNSDTRDARSPQETKRSTQQTQQKRDHNQEEANKTTLKQTESEQLEQEKHAQAEQERLEREQKERAEQERLEREKAALARAEQQSTEGVEEARYQHEAKQLAKLQERSHFRDGLRNRYFIATAAGMTILVLLTFYLKYERRPAKDATTKLLSTEALKPSSAPNNTVASQSSEPSNTVASPSNQASQASRELMSKPTSIPSKRHAPSTSTTKIAGADESAIVKEAFSQPTTQQERQKINVEPQSNLMKRLRDLAYPLGIWTDQETHLTWTSKDVKWKSESDGYIPFRSQKDADLYCTGLILAGLSWRLPTIKELKGLYDDPNALHDGPDAFLRYPRNPGYQRYHIKTGNIHLFFVVQRSKDIDAQSMDVLFDFSNGTEIHRADTFAGTLCVTTDVPHASR